jgi:iron complex outermembrane receptor protein
MPPTTLKRDEKMKPHYSRTVLPLALFLLQSFGALAQSSEEEDLALSYGDKSNISIATGSPQPISKAPSTATVITAQDIRAMGATDLDQVMETVPGVHVSRTANYYNPVYIIRGINGTGTTNPQVLMLQNGIPMNTLYAGDKGTYWGGLSLENVERIEVIRGPGSALYGADAFSGVINIITKTAADTPGTEFGVRGGSFNTKNAWAQHGGKWGAVDVAAYLNIGGTEGSKQTITQDAARLHCPSCSLAPGPVNIGYDSIDGSIDLGYEKWRLRAGYKLRDNVGTGAGSSSALDPVGKTRGERITSDLSWNDPNLSQNWGANFTGSYMHYAETQDQNFQLLPPGTIYSFKTLPKLPTGLAPLNCIGTTCTFPSGMIGDPGRDEQQLRLSAFATYSGFTGHSLRFGLGHDDLNMYHTSTDKNYWLSATGPVPTAFMDYYNIQSHMLPHQRKVDYIYAQDEWNFARDWMLTAGVRQDNYSDFGGTTNPRLALVWDATLDLTAKLLYGQAFRAPSFIEQYGINPTSNGNPNLKPETMKTLEEAFTWQARKDTQINLNFFHYEADDLIQSVANATAGTGSTYQNTGKQHGSGMELEGVWDASRTLRLTGNYSYQKSISEATNQDAGYAPHDHIYLRGDWRFAGGLLSSTQVNRVMDRMRAAGDTRPPVPDYTTVDMTVRTDRSKNQWDYAASVRNLFNATVLEPSVAGSNPLVNTPIPNDLPQAPRSLLFQATHKL